jgi:ABC-type lipoprotein export system ATPase subunit
VSAILELVDVVRDYRGLRPLRIERLAIGAADHVAILGFDRATAEVFLNLITGATVPDRGQVTLFGRASSEIANGDEWLRIVDRFGIVSERAVLLEGLTAIQNLAMPFSLEIEPPSADVLARAEALAREIALPDDQWGKPVGELDPLSRTVVRLGRALALDPAILLLEHPSAPLARADVTRFGRLVRTIASRRGIALLSATADQEFATSAAARVLRLDAATGRLTEKRSRGTISFRSLRTRLWGRR